MNRSLPEIKNKVMLLLKRKEIVIAIVIVLLSMLLAKNLFQEQKRKTAQKENSVALEKEKINLTQEVIALNNKMAQASGPYYKSDSPLSSEKLEELAALSKVSIILVTPEPERDAGFCMVSSFKVSAKASYHALGKFVSMIESNGGVVKIEELSVHREDMPFRDTSMREGLNMLKVDMGISQTFVKK